MQCLCLSCPYSTLHCTTMSHSITSFHLLTPVLCYLTRSQKMMLGFLPIEVKTLRWQKITTHWIVRLALLRWPGTETTMSLRYTCIHRVVGYHREVYSFKNVSTSTCKIAPFTLFWLILMQKHTGGDEGEWLFSSHGDEDILLTNLPQPQPYY